ncbi:winged helix DNA-binding domain-containing protein [Ornithinimicrobium cavernae]|uniref:winged helix DNA-binding domain-containing protein n=1 Tax=Ornithinimicrobium cavernae TaxID=2666047 RepID=UPI0012B17BBD|nr:winged helix DNA-binding domain-containing protein [Ornithinimicrobium cavernae]
MPTDTDIARWRLRSQQLAEPTGRRATEVVSSLLAVQAENPAQSAWAVATRTPAPDPADLDSALADGTIIRTHVLRPTWHYVSAEDLVWLLELTAPRVRRVTGQQLRGTHGLDDRAIDRLTETVLASLADQLTRAQLAAALAAAGHDLTGQALMILLADLELQGLVCSGAPVDGVHTYARLADRVPRPRRLGREEAAAEIVLRYVRGHGPVTERDLSYWATLTLTDVRAGLADVADRLESFEHGGRTFWHTAGEEPPSGPQRPAAHLLQLLDETYRGYQDSRMILDAAGVVPSGREAMIGMALVDGQLVAGMKRTVTGERVLFELQPHGSWSPDHLPHVEDAAARYGAFLGRQPEVRLVG